MSFRAIDELDLQIKHNEQQLASYLELVNRTITEEFRLIHENNTLKELRKTLTKNRDSHDKN